MSQKRLPNSAAARDIAFHLHAQTNPLHHEAEGPLIVERADGPYIFDSQGNRYLDAMAGLWCSSLGFTNDRLAAAAKEAYDTLGFYHTFGGRSSPAVIDAAEAIASRVPLEDAKVFFATSGSEAVETMVKIAWLYHRARGNPGRRKIIARDRAFHGSTIFAASLTGLPHMHREFGLPLQDVLRTRCPDPYRERQEDETPEDFATRLAGELEALIIEEGPDTIAAFVAEPVNAGAGVIVPPPTYFEKVQAVLSRHGILCLDDEIVCGFGRTGSWFGCESVGMKPDMMAMAKGLSSSFFPISAVAVSGEIYGEIAEINRESGQFGHGFTNSGHPVGARIALEAMRIYSDMGLPAWIAGPSEKLRAGLDAACADSPIVGDVRGLGLLFGVELVADREAKAPFPAALNLPARLQTEAMKRGLMLRPQGNTITFCPPFILTDGEIDFMIGTFRESLRAIERFAATSIGAVHET